MQFVKKGGDTWQIYCVILLNNDSIRVSEVQFYFIFKGIRLQPYILYTVVIEWRIYKLNLFFSTRLGAFSCECTIHASELVFCVYKNEHMCMFSVSLFVQMNRCV